MATADSVGIFRIVLTSHRCRSSTCLQESLISSSDRYDFKETVETLGAQVVKREVFIIAQEWTPSHASLLPSCPCRPTFAGFHPSLQVPFQGDAPRPSSCTLRRSAGSADHHSHFPQSTKSFFPKVGPSTKDHDSLLFWV